MPWRLAGNAARADDLVQDCIERALGQEAQLREAERLAGWLRRILYHLYIDEIRRNRRRGREQDITELADHLELSAPAPDNSAMREFIHAVNRLSVEHRQILLLVMRGGIELSRQKSRADELEVPLGTVMSRLARARERLRDLLLERHCENHFPVGPEEKRVSNPHFISMAKTCTPMLMAALAEERVTHWCAMRWPAKSCPGGTRHALFQADKAMLKAVYAPLAERPLAPEWIARAHAKARPRLHWRQVCAIAAALAGGGRRSAGLAILCARPKR